MFNEGCMSHKNKTAFYVGRLGNMSNKLHI